MTTEQLTLNALALDALKDAAKHALAVMRQAARVLSDLPSTNKLGTKTRDSWNDLNDFADKLGDAIAALEAAQSQPVTEKTQDEPFGFITEYQWSKFQSETILKITQKAQPEYGFTVPLYRHSPAAPNAHQKLMVVTGTRK